MMNQNIIMVCQQSWDLEIGSNAKNLAKEFAKQNRVLYVNMPLDINTVLRNYRQPEVKKKILALVGQVESLVQQEANIWVYTPDILCLSINWVSSQKLFTIFNHFNSWLLARSIRKATKTLEFQKYFLLQDGLLFQGQGLKALLKPQKFIYYLRDYMITMPYFRRHGPNVEMALLRESDVVATNSAYLADYAHQYNSQSYNIGQGCVLSLYQVDALYTLPEDLAVIPEPRIGYTGYLTDLRLDLELLSAIARRYPSWSLVLIGPEDAAFSKSELHMLPNVYFLGAKKPERLPAYLHYLDICINPQIVNDITSGNYPLKIDEYLAMGKPIVATHTRTMEMFQQFVHLAKSEDEWMELLEYALLNKNEQQMRARVEFAQSHTWENSVSKLYKTL